MRRRDVSPEELARIIRLRQSNTSWLKIERDTGVPRRIAQRAHEQYLHSQAGEQLKTARKDVAAEEFRNHLACLVKLGQFLFNTFAMPGPSHNPISADEVLLSLWKRDIVGKYGAYGLPERVDISIERYSEETCLRQNLLLFKCLKDHTREKNWQALDDWKEAWDTCNRILNKNLPPEARKILLNILNQKAGLMDRIVKGSRKKDVVERMVEGMLDVLWQGIKAGRGDSQFPLIEEAISQTDGTSEVVFGEEGRFRYMLIFPIETNLGREVKDVCIWAVNNLRIEREKDMTELVNKVSIMRKAIDDLTEILNPLTLKREILRTQCDLCPV